MGAEALLKSLRRRKEIRITVRGRRTARKITLPVWFVLDDSTLWLLPVKGSRSHWFRNLGANPSLVIQAGERRATTTAELLTGRARVRSVVERFRRKYGRADVARYYSRFDAAVKVPL
jgi:deazaflavin-dependent oxidoreductase (nitroreductase family)